MSIIGQRITELRQVNGISQEKLADLLGTGRSTIIRYENGQTFPNSESIVSLCHIFQVSADYLLGLNEAESSVSPNPSLLSPPSAPEIEINITKNIHHPSQSSPSLTTPEEIKRYIDQAIESAFLKHIKK